MQWESNDNSYNDQQDYQPKFEVRSLFEEAGSALSEFAASKAKEPALFVDVSGLSELYASVMGPVPASSGDGLRELGKERERSDTQKNDVSTKAETIKLCVEEFKDALKTSDADLDLKYKKFEDALAKGLNKGLSPQELELEINKALTTDNKRHPLLKIQSDEGEPRRVSIDIYGNANVNGRVYQATEKNGKWTVEETLGIRGIRPLPAPDASDRPEQKAPVKQTKEEVLKQTLDMFKDVTAKWDKGAEPKDQEKKVAEAIEKVLNSGVSVEDFSKAVRNEVPRNRFTSQPMLLKAADRIEDGKREVEFAVHPGQIGGYYYMATFEKGKWSVQPYGAVR